MCSCEILPSLKPTMTATAISTGLPVGAMPGSSQSIAVVWVKLISSSSTMLVSPTVRDTEVIFTSGGQDLGVALRRGPGVCRGGRNDDGPSRLGRVPHAVDLDPDIAPLDHDDFLVGVDVPRDRDGRLDPVAQHAGARGTLCMAGLPASG